MAEKGKTGAVCYKHDALAFGTGIVDVERGGFSEAKPYPAIPHESMSATTPFHTGKPMPKHRQGVGQKQAAQPDGHNGNALV